MTFKEIAHTVMAGSPADETEVVYRRRDESLTRFANNHIHQNVTESNYQITIRCVAGTRVGTAVSNDVREVSLRALVQRAGELAKPQPDATANANPSTRRLHNSRLKYPASALRWYNRNPP